MQNPGKKPLQVTIASFPKAETGFEIDFVSFALNGREQTEIRVGWVPQKHGNQREKIMVRYGTCLTQILLVATCPQPPEKVSIVRQRVRSKDPQHRSLYGFLVFSSFVTTNLRPLLVVLEGAATGRQMEAKNSNPMKSACLPLLW